ncbi:DNA polymerase eta [Trypanosoma grayi]|uniref:DNA polymerase eta n=1 Tax=Trypanosoma grayi TaxID=71804 RepID=UPI0004F46DC1|nr:DNA polymerase eta [Trypanosoma grayi]KEG12076.1 DNA polymerase eta [Trypanosoma grayi]
MDCFYAQVEAVRLGIDCRTEPYILSQWGNLIAVNYPARSCGIARFNTVEEAREKCPHVRVSHVATYAVGESEYKYHVNPRKGTHKVALEPYREASRHIFNILRSFEGVEVEKGSVDEAFLDVTVAAQRELESVELLHSQRLHSLEDILEPSTHVIPDRQDEIDVWLRVRGKKFCDVFDAAMHPKGSLEHALLLGAAARVVWSIRQKIRQELHYDCSAGIAHNKLLSKFISSRHKPNQQTLLLPDRVASAIWDTQYHNFRGFGGKFGETIRHICGGAELCCEAWLVPKEVMRGVFGDDDAEYAYQRLRGYSSENITKRSIAKTLMASKVFRPAATSPDGVRKWVTVLSSELCARYRGFCDTYQTKGHTLNVKLGNMGLSQLGGVVNKTLVLPELVTTETLIAAAMQCVTATLVAQPGVAVNAVTLTIGSFKKQVDECGSGRGQQLALTSFFSAKGKEKRRRSEPDEAVVVTLSSTSSSSSTVEEWREQSHDAEESAIGVQEARDDDDGDVIIIE